MLTDSKPTLKSNNRNSTVKSEGDLMPNYVTMEELALLKQLKAAGERGRTVRSYDTRLALDRLAKGVYVVAHPIGLELVQYRITARGQEVVAEHD
jgi:hypothetical protein